MSEQNPRGLARLRIPAKLTLLVLALGFVALVIAASVILRQRVEISEVRTQRQGVDALKRLHQLSRQVEQHRDGLDGRLSRIGEGADLAGTRQEIDEQLSGLEALGGLERDATDTLGRVSRNWRNIANRFESFDARQSFDAHGRVLEDLVDLSLMVGEGSGLRTPPDLATFYLADTAMARLLDAILQVSWLRARAQAVASTDDRSAEDAAELARYRSAIGPAIEVVDRNLELAFVQGAGLRQDGEELWRRAASRVEVLQALVEQELERDVSEPVAASEELFLAGDEAIDGLFAVADFDLDALDRLLEEREELLGRQLALVVGGLALGFLLSGSLAWLIARGITGQLREITSVLQQIGIGNYAARSVVRTGDELGQVARTLNGMLDSTLLLIQSREQRDVQLQRIVEDVQATAREVGVTAEGIRSRTEELAAGSDNQRDKIGEISEAIARMASSIQQVSGNCAAAATVARDALQNARQGTDVVSRTARGMSAVRGRVQETSKRLKRLGESSQEIGEIAKVINDIAERTSMLAINAAIQAASAGEYGRGFTVVATEVERLAERSADATKRIELLISTIQSETAQTVVAMEETTREVVEGSQLADDAGRALTELEKVSQRLAELIEMISDASNEQAGTSEVVAGSMGQISQVSRLTASGTREAASSIRDLAGLLDSLQESVLAIRPAEEAA